MLFFTDYNLPELEDQFAENGMKKFRARQLFDWFYVHGVDDYSEMSNLPKNFKKFLDDNFILKQSEVKEVKKAADESEKFLIKLARDEQFVESVWIPMGSHATVCVSTQVGCPIKCNFCASGALGFDRNLSAGEIVEQVWHCARAHSRRGIKNLVFMGMGEPFLNYDNLIKAIKILNEEKGLKIGARRMTVSTVGFPKKIINFANDAPQVNLAVSLHAPTDDLRKRLIPAAPTKIPELICALRDYFNITHRKITFEYVLLKGINDSLKQAAALAKIIKKVPSKINLIEYNKVEFNDYEPPAENVTEKFSKFLIKKGIDVTVRRKKGDDVNAACGQLRMRKINR